MPASKPSGTRRIVKVAVPVPLRKCLDYLCPDALPAIGARVTVPLGRRQVVGVAMAHATSSNTPLDRLKPITQILDDQPLFDAATLKLLIWAADYYVEPIGQVVATALPPRLRQAIPAQANGRQRYFAKENAEFSGRRAPRQETLLASLRQHRDGMSAEDLAQIPGSRPALKALLEKELVYTRETPCLEINHEQQSQAPNLNDEQRVAIARIEQGLAKFSVFLLAGVTGSGKTEVYLAAVQRVLEAGKQALILSPEISLTPQFVERFRARFKVPIAVLHSGLSDGDRHCAWWSASRGLAAIVIGTRSAVFTPLPKLGLIVVDEEHDTSYKQQDGFRYHARDLAVYRARLQSAPIVLGSATPGLESLKNADLGKYALLELTQRAGKANPPKIEIIDLRATKAIDGLSEPLLAEIARQLASGGQVLLFLNRRGFAPVLYCCECAWASECERCDARMTLHGNPGVQRCHHCDAQRPIPAHCPKCGSLEIKPIGAGTQRVEQALREYFPDAPIVRIDRDSTRGRDKLEALHRQVLAGEHRILIGTQMLSKGHDFPQVGLVGVLNTDQALYHTDFRASERFAQLMVQVSGRAGRAERPGRVLLQTEMPDHPLLIKLLKDGYFAVCQDLLTSRKQMGLPPWKQMALIRAEAVQPKIAMEFLKKLKRLLAREQEAVELMGPAPAPMEKLRGRIRAHLLISAHARAPLNRILCLASDEMQGIPGARQVRVAIDVDPVELI